MIFWPVVGGVSFSYIVLSDESFLILSLVGVKSDIEVMILWLYVVGRVRFFSVKIVTFQKV